MKYLVLVALGLFSAFAFAEYDCYTYSNEILFKAAGDNEAQTSADVVEGCKENLGTNPVDCENNVKCFSQSQDVSGSIRRQ